MRRTVKRAAEILASTNRGDLEGYNQTLGEMGLLLMIPRIVCLCGSTRFYEAWQDANFNETIAGRIVLSVGFYPHAADKAHAAHVGITPEQKAALDELHFRKIDLADEVLVLNVDGYIGESTGREIKYAESQGKRIRYLHPESFFDPSGGKDSKDRRPT